MSDELDMGREIDLLAEHEAADVQQGGHDRYASNIDASRFPSGPRRRREGGATFASPHTHGAIPARPPLMIAFAGLERSSIEVARRVS